MKKYAYPLAIFSIVLAIMFVVGCISSTNDNSQAQSQVQSKTIIGTWKATDGTNDFRIQFNNDSSLLYTNNGGADIVYGTWTQKGTLDNGDTVYTVTKSGTIETYILSKSKNGIYSTSYPSLVFTAYSGGMGLAIVSSTPVSPTTTPIQSITPVITTAQNPIIGTWRYSVSSGSELAETRIRFSADGTFKLSIFNTVDGTSVYAGTWTNQGENVYTLNPGTSSPLTWFYVPDKNAIYWDKYPGQLYIAYAGDVMTLSPTSAETSSSGGSKVTTFTGSGDDVQSFTAYGDGIRIFSMRYTGSSNFIVWLEDSDGDKLDLLANEIGSYSGKTSERMGSGKYYLDVQASGPWTITLTSE